MSQRKIVVNMVEAMDGSIVKSRHRHDYVEHICDIGGHKYRCVVDGGIDYLRRSGKFIERTLYADDNFSEIRKYLDRGGRGKSGKEPLEYVALCDIDYDWLEAIIEYEEVHRPDNRFLEYYKKEKEYRDAKKENRVT